MVVGQSRIPAANGGSVRRSHSQAVTQSRGRARAGFCHAGRVPKRSLGGRQRRIGAPRAFFTYFTIRKRKLQPSISETLFVFCRPLRFRLSDRVFPSSRPIGFRPAVAVTPRASVCPLPPLPLLAAVPRKYKEEPHLRLLPVKIYQTIFVGVVAPGLSKYKCPVPSVLGRSAVSV